MKHPSFIILCFSIFLTHCALYKVDVQQGNVLTQAMLDQLEIGMPKSKIKFLLGTPLVIDVFHQNRWDYIYSMQSGNEQREQRRISLFFEDEKLAQITGNVVIGTRKSDKSEPIREIPMEKPVL